MIAAELSATRLCFGDEDITSIYADRFWFVHFNATATPNVTAPFATPLSRLPRGQPALCRRWLRSSAHRANPASSRWLLEAHRRSGLGRSGAGLDQVAIRSAGRVRLRARCPQNAAAR